MLSHVVLNVLLFVPPAQHGFKLVHVRRLNQFVDDQSQEGQEVLDLLPLGLQGDLVLRRIVYRPQLLAPQRQV